MAAVLTLQHGPTSIPPAVGRAQRWAAATLPTAVSTHLRTRTQNVPKLRGLQFYVFARSLDAERGAVTFCGYCLCNRKGGNGLYSYLTDTMVYYEIQRGNENFFEVVFYYILLLLTHNSFGVV